MREAFLELYMVFSVYQPDVLYLVPSQRFENRYYSHIKNQYIGFRVRFHLVNILTQKLYICISVIVLMISEALHLQRNPQIKTFSDF